MDIGKEFLQSVGKRFEEYKNMGDKTFEQLNEEAFHYQPNPESNSIAIIIQHMHGNMLSRWTNFLSEDGEKTWRRRDDEFEIHSLTKNQLIEKWQEGWSVFLTAIRALTPEDLSKTVHIRNQPLTVIDAINRQMAHYSYHVGQIVYLGRWAKGPEWQTLSIPKKKS